MPEPPRRWRLIIGPDVEKRLKRTTPKDRARITSALDALATDPSRADFKPLRGRPEWRLRVGRWRVLLRVDPQARTIWAVDAGPRGDIYK